MAAFRTAALFGCVAALLQPLSGDRSAKDVARRQPAKLAAMEAHFHTSERAPLVIGGVPNEEEKQVKYGIYLPGFLSFLAHGDFDAEVTGLDQIPQTEQPPVAIVHYAFQVMVGIGVLLLTIAILFFCFVRKNRWRKKKMVAEIICGEHSIGIYRC